MSDTFGESRSSGQYDHPDRPPPQSHYQAQIAEGAPRRRRRRPDAEDAAPSPSGRWVPVPDPTSLTTEQLLREIAGLKAFLMSSIEAASDVTAERFNSVNRGLALVEQQRVEQKSDTKAAVDAALTAQKEAVKEQTTASERAIAKSEAATTKQLEQLNATFSTAISGVTAILNDTKDRVGAIENRTVGQTEQVSTQRASMASLYALVGAAVAVIGLVIVLATVLTRTGG